MAQRLVRQSFGAIAQTGKRLFIDGQMDQGSEQPEQFSGLLARQWQRLRRF